MKRNDYIAPAEFETLATGPSELIFAYLFARDVAISAAYTAGHVVALSQSPDDVKVLFHDCPLHEYGHLGSPIFNQKGKAIGMCYASQSRTHAWTVSFLKKQFDLLLKNWRIKYVCSSKQPNQEGGSSYHEHTNQDGDQNKQGMASSLTSASIPPMSVSPEASNHPPPPNSSSGMDMDPGDVPHPVAKRPKTGCFAPLPLGVVTLACGNSASTTTTYLTGIIITCEQGQGNEYTTLVISLHKAKFDQVDVYFEPTRRVEAEVCSYNIQERKEVCSYEPDFFMLVRVKDTEYHEPLTWSSRSHPGFELVQIISMMAGTKLTAKAAAPILRSLTGVLGLYAGQIITPRCNAATASSCKIESSTEKYFQLSCPFQDDFVTLKNVDLDKDGYECDRVLSAPVFSLKGDFVGIVVCSGNWPDTKTGLYSEFLLPIIEELTKHLPNSWSKDKLKWSLADSV